ncbi:hypothetical protein GQ607_015743 [Colletotrichum asianum]|uniref:Uncharacterized protein n=1 Tax=Colletotrichum asianum TaxID=702518 RepID=A0A8H3ZKK5_9PEZI|nr:hypothetical protein GQ607_015743 [Colletotrichum asianum]
MRKAPWSLSIRSRQFRDDVQIRAQLVLKAKC